MRLWFSFSFSLNLPIIVLCENHKSWPKPIQSNRDRTVSACRYLTCVHVRVEQVLFVRYARLSGIFYIVFSPPSASPKTATRMCDEWCGVGGVMQINGSTLFSLFGLFSFSLVTVLFHIDTQSGNQDLKYQFSVAIVFANTIQ